MFTTYVVWCFFVSVLINPVQSDAIDNSLSLSTENPVLYVGGTGLGNYSHIQYALDNATEGATIFVYDDSSPYYENILIERSVSLIGENKVTTIIDGLSRYYVISIYANDVTVSDFTIQYGGSGWSTGGIYVAGTDVIVKQNIIQYNANGVFIEGASYNHILNNTIQHNIYHAVRLEYTSFNRIIDNSIINNDNGIYMWESPDNVIVRNVLNYNNWAGIILGEFCDRNSIFHNTFMNNQIEHAYDLSNNSWDAGYPLGGNYWDDYDGEDIDQDGIGDIPYVIRGPNAVDYYPLMQPYGYEIPEVRIEITGGIGLSVVIEDLRENSSLSLPIDIILEYSYPIRELLRPGGTLNYQSEYNISNNQKINHKGIPPYFLGFGTVKVTVEILSLLETTEKQVISWFVLPA
jgi:parallel beta-helix repeat protein